MTTTASASTKINPVEYAEKVLGVHLPWDEAQQRLEQHALAQDRMTMLRSNLRGLKNDLEAHKIELLNQGAAMWPNDSVTARREKTKSLIASDGEHTRLEEAITECQFDLESAEADVRHHELGLHVLTARMTELGGLLNFYAEVKREITMRQTTNSSPGLAQGEPTQP